MNSKFPIITHINKRRAEKNVISIELGKKYTANFRDIVGKNSQRLKEIFNLPLAESFDRNAIALLLKQKGAEGIRIYLGVNPANKELKLILVPIDAKGKDIIVPLLKIKDPDIRSAASATEGTVDRSILFSDESDDDYYTAHDEVAHDTAADSTSRDPQALDGDGRQVVNSGQRCPTVCDEDSDLNNDN